MKPSHSGPAAALDRDWSVSEALQHRRAAPAGVRGLPSAAGSRWQQRGLHGSRSSASRRASSSSPIRVLIGWVWPFGRGACQVLLIAKTRAAMRCCQVFAPRRERPMGKKRRANVTDPPACLFSRGSCPADLTGGTPGEWQLTKIGEEQKISRAAIR